jgi:hypothetical protein
MFIANAQKRRKFLKEYIVSEVGTAMWRLGLKMLKLPQPRLWLHLVEV